MKHTFIAMQFAPKPQTGNNVKDEPKQEAPKQDEPAKDEPAKDEPAEPVYSSPKLTEINAKIEAIEDQIDKVGNRTPEGRKLRGQIFNLEAERDKEVQVIKDEIKRLEKEAEIEKTIQLNRVQFGLWDELKAANEALSKIPVENRTADTPELIAANDCAKRLKDAQEVVENRLLGGIVTTKRAVSSNGSAGKGNISGQILALLPELYKTMNPSQVRAHLKNDLGFNDGTSNAVVHEYECVNSLNGKNPAMSKK